MREPESFITRHGKCIPLIIFIHFILKNKKIKNKMNKYYSMDFIRNAGIFVHDHILYLNSSKFFAGIVMIILNICSKFITIKFSESAEEYMKLNVTKQILVFSMCWMGTRDIYTALILTAIFTFLSDHIFNEESPYCCVPHKFRLFKHVTDTDKDELYKDEHITDEDVNKALLVLEKAKQQNYKAEQKNTFLKFHNYISTPLV